MPADDPDSVLARERRTHNKFIVTEQSAIIGERRTPPRLTTAGTSNWSGDYFTVSTGVALVVTQNRTRERPFITQIRDIFIRDWRSPYAHQLQTYMNFCLNNATFHAHNPAAASICEVEKDLHMHFAHAVHK